MAMSYEDFLDIAKDAAKTRHPEADVTIQKVEKLQGESYVRRTGAGYPRG